MERKTNPTKYERQARERIQLLIDEFCNGSQQAFADKSGVHKSSISQYINGKNIPSNLTAIKLCEPFGVNPAWLMGFDVPKYETPSAPSSLESKTPACDPNERELITYCNQLNEEGQLKLLDYAADLVASGRYKKACRGDDPACISMDA